MKASKLTAAVVVGLSMVLSLSGAAASAKKKLVWFADQKPFYDLADKFEKQNPGVEVQLVSGNMDKFYAMITAGMMPDIWGPWGTPGIRADVNRNWAMDLTPYIKRDGKSMNINDFFPGVMREFRVNGKMYSLPIYSYVDYYFYNISLYAKAGLVPPPIDAHDKSWNWDRMVADARKITRFSPSGLMQIVGLDFSREVESPSHWHLWGAEPYSKKALASSVPQQISYNTPEMLAALTETWNLIYKYKVSGDKNRDFKTGTVGASIIPGWNIFNYMQTKNLKWKIANLPWAKTNSGTLWPDGWRISKVSKNKDLAWKFIKFVCSPESMRYIVSLPISAANPVTRRSVFNDSLGRNIGKATGMSPADVYKVQSQADEVGIVKYSETICIERDMAQFIGPTVDKLYANEISPQQAAVNLQKVVDQRLPELFKRWIRNIKFTGAE